MRQQKNINGDFLGTVLPIDFTKKRAPIQPIRGKVHNINVIKAAHTYSNMRYK